MKPCYSEVKQDNYNNLDQSLKWRRGVLVVSGLNLKDLGDTFGFYHTI